MPGDHLMRSVILNVAVIPAVLLVFLVSSGCGMQRAPANAFPGTGTYTSRVESFKISPKEAHRIAYEAGKRDGQLQYISRTPTVILKRWYVFSIPKPTDATIQGYHVNGDTGEVKFVNEKRAITNPGR